jgi:Na+/H+ antiporter NhaD/arsenite permease-like protein
MVDDTLAGLQDFSTNWLLPFAGFVLLIAIAPVAGESFWHKHYRLIICLWIAVFAGALAYVKGWQVAYTAISASVLGNYFPFIVLVTALYVLTSGVFLDYPFRATPSNNTIYLGLSALLASFMGTMGASALMIRPLVRANAGRKRSTHVVIFFIFMVSNIGGGYTPLGDPPLFVGFLNGVDFYWNIQHLLLPCLFMIAIISALFFAIDSWLCLLEAPAPAWTSRGRRPLLSGKINILLLAGAVVAVTLTAFWPNPPMIEVLSVRMKLSSAVRDLVLIALMALSARLTPASVWKSNEFSWRPAIEVGTIFLGVFVTIAPVALMLREGKDGPLAALFGILSQSDGQPSKSAYFWLTGALSSFLDNAPTYLVFFNAAGANAAQLMDTHAPTLMAISTGAVFMGANTYIGNAPNLMVKSLAEHNGMKMPGFFGYMAWSGGILIPLFLLFDWVYFR